MVARSETSGSWGGRGVRAVCSTGAGRTHGLPEGDPDRGRAVAIRSCRPHDAPLPWRADRVSAVPVEHPLGCRTAGRGRPWPTLIAWPRAQPVEPVLAPPRQEGVGTYRPRLAARFPRCHLPRGEGGLERGQPSNICGGSWCGQDSGEARGRLVITGCGARHRVPRPRRRALLAGAGLRGIGGTAQQRRWRQVVGMAPAPRLVIGARGALLEPARTQRLHGWDVPPPSGRGRSGDGPQQWAALHTDLRGQGVAGGLFRRQARVRKPLSGASEPHGWHPGLAPVWRNRGPHLERRAPCFATALQPIARLDGRQHRRGVGALTALSRAQPLLADPRQHGRAQQECRLARAQALAALAQDRGLDARGGPIQGQGLCPVTPRPHGIRSLGVRETCGTLHNGEQGERCRGFRWSSGVRKERSKVWMRIERPSGVSQAPRGLPCGECGAGSLAGLLRNAVTG